MREGRNMRQHINNQPQVFSPIFKFAVSRAEAAALLDISTGTFDEWVRRKWMPAGIKIGALRRWDVAEILAAWRVLVEKNMLVEEDDDGENPFDHVVG